MRASFFQRIILPGFAFKAVVIGGGYATGRELVEFFFDAGPLGGLYGLLTTMIIWSLVCAATFLVARAFGAYDYRTFFRALLGRGWPLFEIAYVALMLLILSVFAAAAGEIARAGLGIPAVFGTLGLTAAIIAVTAAGRHAMETMFKYVSIFLYLVYATFIILTLSRFGGRISETLAAGAPTTGWFSSGLTYAGYNLVGAIVILPMARHIASNRDAVVAGLLCGPMAALPAFLFFVCLIGFYPDIQDAPLPSDVMLTALDLPIFHLVFQTMILAALLESGAGLVHALNERVAGVLAGKGRDMPATWRFALAAFILFGAVVVATRVGLVDLIARGYAFSAYVFLLIYVLPVMTIGLLRVATRERRQDGPCLAEASPGQGRSEQGRS
ncbi:hypothetical protein RCO27_14525 [Sphingosinicella sp. LHD-64]|uniref:YkvI family membrane protein n=1 Tax=Sphingosinicella sp. LHD-64 TaxID=3072139 RepID=UPI00280D635A|nr:hypothetical protein [Sphingosinicella sp. LHD-64]MDQ8757443.1 hypothetical protein [Sphingosinicella sp. LHD-64]